MFNISYETDKQVRNNCKFREIHSAGPVFFQKQVAKISIFVRGLLFGTVSGFRFEKNKGPTVAVTNFLN